MAYSVTKYDCEVCALKPECRPNVRVTKIERSVYEADPTPRVHFTYDNAVWPVYPRI